MTIKGGSNTYIINPNSHKEIISKVHLSPDSWWMLERKGLIFMLFPRGGPFLGIGYYIDLRKSHFF